MMPAVIEYRPYGLGSLVAFVSIAFPNGCQVCNITYFANANGLRWVQPPVDVYTKDSGEIAFLPILEFDSADDYKAFQTQVLDAIDRYLADRNAYTAFL